MLNRRGFFGNVLGMIGTVPFILEEAKAVPLSSQQLMLKAWIKIFLRPHNQLSHYRIAAITDKGHVFWAPNITSVSRVFKPKEAQVLFQATPLAITRTLTVVGQQLVSKEGQLLVLRKYSGPMNVMFGDSLNMSHTITQGLPEVTA